VSGARRGAERGRERGCRRLHGSGARWRVHSRLRRASGCRAFKPQLALMEAVSDVNQVDGRHSLVHTHRLRHRGAPLCSPIMFSLLLPIQSNPIPPSRSMSHDFTSGVFLHGERATHGFSTLLQGSLLAEEAFRCAGNIHVGVYVLVGERLPG
jgi:hypothetical protein